MGSMDDGESFKAVGRSKVKNRLRQLSLSEGFPSRAVYDAYADPVVDDSLEEFSWASSPDLAGVREFARVKFGWSREKTDESLLPVVEKMKERKGDTIDKWVKRWSNRAVAAKKAQGIPSKRIKKILVDLDVLQEEDLETGTTAKATKSKEPKKKVAKEGEGMGKGGEMGGGTRGNKKEAKNKTTTPSQRKKKTTAKSSKNDDEFRDPDSVGFPDDNATVKPKLAKSSKTVSSAKV